VHGITQLREDLERFAFLLGCSDGEQLFGHDQDPRPRQACAGRRGPQRRSSSR